MIQPAGGVRRILLVATRVIADPGADRVVVVGDMDSDLRKGTAIQMGVNLQQSCCVCKLSAPVQRPAV
jgi:hypothetical protein